MNMELLGEIDYTDDQLKIVKAMMEMAENFTDQLWHIMENHGLNKKEGCGILIEINPKYPSFMKRIEFGEGNSPSGYIELVKGESDKYYVPTSNEGNSPEYEFLFALPTLAKRMQKIADNAKPLPADGLWVGADYNSDHVDPGEWDVNDILS